MADISIIVPIYNAEKYIKKCLDSLINQTKKELEFILVNDGSTDNSEKIIKQYNDSRIKYFKNKNQGIGKTRNFGIKKATGKYIMFLDSDDYLDTSCTEALFKKAEKDNLDLVVCDFTRVVKDQFIEERICKFKNTTLKEMPSLLTKINLSPWNKLYASALIKENNIYFVEDLKYEDAPFVSMALDKAKKIGKVDKCLNYYVIHEKSETTIRDERVFDIIKIVDLINQYFKEKDYMKETVKMLIVKILTNYTIQQREQKDKKIGLKFIDEAFNYMQENVSDYKDNKYYEARGLFRRTIEKNKLLTKAYCLLYRK